MVKGNDDSLVTKLLKMREGTIYTTGLGSTNEMYYKPETGAFIARIGNVEGVLLGLMNTHEKWKEKEQTIECPNCGLKMDEKLINKLKENQYG